MSPGPFFSRKGSRLCSTRATTYITSFLLFFSLSQTTNPDTYIDIAL